MLKRRIKKASKATVSKVSGRHYLVCTECNIEEVLVGTDIGATVCGRCVQKMVALYPIVTKISEKSIKLLLGDLT